MQGYCFKTKQLNSHSLYSTQTDVGSLLVMSIVLIVKLKTVHCIVGFKTGGWEPRPEYPRVREQYCSESDTLA